MNEIDAEGYEQKWELDPKGYFLIRINRDTKEIEVGHCEKQNKVDVLFKGKNPESIMYKIIDMGFISRFDHAAYIGKEIEKAFLALKLNLQYTQDEELG
jgi:tetrahydromethanopterin S-methyltransferase subunit A